MKKVLSGCYRFAGSWTGTITIVLFLIFFVAQSFVIPSGSMKRTLLIGDFLFAKKFSYGIPTPHLPWLEIPLLPDFNGNGHLIEGPRPQRGDIVIFRNPETPKVHFVKRCVAVGEDEVIYDDKQLYIRPHEGDNFIKANFDSKLIVKLGGTLWVKDPYIDKYPGINYTPQPDMNTFDELMARAKSPLASTPFIVDMQPVFVDELHKEVLYRKVPKDSFYMMGDNRENSSDSRFWGPVPYANIVGKPWLIYFSLEAQSYDTLIDKSTGGDHSMLMQACDNIDIHSTECRKIWDKERFHVRWSRVGQLIDDMELKQPIK